MNNSIFIGVASLLIGGVGGYLAGNSGGGQLGGEENGARHASKGSRSVTGGGGGGGGGGAVHRTKGLSIEQIRSEPGQTARMQSLLDFYAALDPSQFSDEAEKLESLPFGERMVAG